MTLNARAAAAMALAAALVAFLAGPAPAQLDRLLKDAPGLPKIPGVPSTGAGLSEDRIISGLKEALQVGTQNTVNLTGKLDGYFANQAIRILMPERLQTLEKGLRAVGYGAQVDEFVLGMNRAAERAAPAARSIFGKAITEMSFDDARKILSGGDTAATEYFKEKTSAGLAAAFRPTVEAAMNEVGVTRQYKELVGRAKAIPFLKTQTFDVDQYVVDKGLDGLFHVLGDEEKKIRTNPAARTTQILKDVFGK
jgi:hypothetical protein